MTPPALKTGLLLTALAAVLAASGCGSDKEGKQIPSTQVSALERQLGALQRRLDFGDGACKDIQNDSRPQVEAILASIPSDVDAKVRSSLRQSFDRLWELADSQCDTTKNERTTPETTPAPTPTEPPQTQTTETTPTEPTTTEPTPKKPGKEKKTPGGGAGSGGAGTGGN